jgi:hypothetical protein
LSTYIFRDASFSSEIFILSQGTKVILMRLRGFGLLGVKAVVKYKANVASDFNDGDRHFGERSLYYCLITWHLHIINEMLHVSERKVEYIMNEWSFF